MGRLPESAKRVTSTGLVAPAIVTHHTGASGQDPPGASAPASAELRSPYGLAPFNAGGNLTR